MNIKFVVAKKDLLNDPQYRAFSEQINDALRELENEGHAPKAVTAITGWGLPTVMIGYDSTQDGDLQDIILQQKTNQLIKTVGSRLGLMKE